VERFELVVIGSGPGGQRAAVQAAKLGRRVAIVERRRELGGVCINTGTVPSKTLREAVLDLSGRRQRRLYGESYAPKQRPDMFALMRRTHQVMQAEREVVDAQLARNGVTVMNGTAWFLGPNEIAVTDVNGVTRTLTTEHAVIATGTTPGLPDGIHVDHKVVLTSDDLLCMETLPKDLMIVGGGIVGLEYGCMLAALGVKVTLVDQRTQLLEMVDRELVDAFCTQAREMGLTLRLGEQVANIVTGAHGHAVVTMKSGKRVVAETVLVSAGRRGATDALALDNAGITVDERGRIPVDAHYRTVTPHIYAVGDVIGFPALAATSAEQGRLAACHMFDEDAPAMTGTLPFGIYAIPEIGWVGANEAELTAKGVPYETGVARYREIARGHILGDHEGMLKLIFHLDTLEVLGVWCMGTQATELVHIGQAVMQLGGTVEYFVRNVFNYPTLAECYKVAALNGMNKLRALHAELESDDEEPRAAA